MFYAGFELRCGIEARLFEQIANEKEVSNKTKKGWRFAFLGKEVERVLQN
ncbi:hypothetical protein LEP1GSC039_0948 [Leptospira santarosai str. 2000027870]|nr:hypothetical protein LEP1GSC039_0948 [Leptospira santarosai str. 2000027870]